MKNKKSKIKTMFKIIGILFKLIKYIFTFTFNIIDRIIEKITNKLRFSITFKITFTYVFIFIIFFSIMGAGIMGSYDFFIKNGSRGNYANTLSAILSGCFTLGLILIIIIGARASKKLLSPIDTMTKMVKKISINQLDERLDVSGSKDELKDLAQTFNDTLNRLQKSIELQNQFVSDASHELRTPISVIQGYANLLDRWGKDDPKILEESISSIKSEAEAMKSLVEKLLFLARGDKNTQKIEKSEFLLNQIIDEVIRETSMIDKTHHLYNNFNDEFLIYADKNLLKEAIRIFVDNSIKYTPEGGNITLDSIKKSNSALITIKDTGIGISKVDIPNIFNRFYRADKSRTKSSGGTGLGLSIAKWIIDNHHGLIDVASKEDEGTTIVIQLPLK